MSQRWTGKKIRKVCVTKGSKKGNFAYVFFIFFSGEIFDWDFTLGFGLVVGLSMDWTLRFEMPLDSVKEWKMRSSRSLSFIIICVVQVTMQTMIFFTPTTADDEGQRKKKTTNCVSHLNRNDIGETLSIVNFTSKDHKSVTPIYDGKSKRQSKKILPSRYMVLNSTTKFKGHRWGICDCRQQPHHRPVLPWQWMYAAVVMLHLCGCQKDSQLRTTQFC